MGTHIVSALTILKCFASEDEKSKVIELLNTERYKIKTEDGSLKKINRESFDVELSNDDSRAFTFYKDAAVKKPQTEVCLQNSTVPVEKPISLETYLKNNGIPFKMWVSSKEASSAQIRVFDGVRLNSIPSDDKGNAYVDMRALRSIIDMLEDDREILALSYSNTHWVETDVENMWRYGMETVYEFSTKYEKRESVIDVEVEEE